MIAVRRLSLVVACAMTACANQSAYQRSSAATGEIVWGYSGGLVATRNGVEIASSGSWTGLEASLSCVEQAADRAAGTAGAKIAGQAMFWTGLTAIPVSSVGGIYMVVEGDSKTGWITLGAGLAGAVIAMVAGAALSYGADADAVDAVNIYNDHIADGSKCGLSL